MVLPAHAAASGTSLSDPCTVIRMAGTQSTKSVKVRVNGYVTPAVGGLSTEIVATPAGAGSNPLIVMLGGVGWSFLITPTLLGAIILVMVELIYNNLGKERQYPTYWW